MRITQRDVLDQLAGCSDVHHSHQKPKVHADTLLREIFDDEESTYPLFFAEILFLSFPIPLPDREWVKVLRKELPIDEEMDLESLNWDDVSPLATFGELADAFLKRIPAPQFEPLNICFQNCRAAGAFEDLRYLGRRWAEHYDVQITPSTRLNEVIGTRSMEYFWKRLQLFLKNQLPATRNLFSYKWFSLAYFLGLAGILPSLFFIDRSSLYPLILFLLVLYSYVYAGIRISQCHWAPEGVVTFRDLSVLIADTIDGKRNTALTVEPASRVFE